MLVGVPWSSVSAAPKGNLIVDPTTTAVSNHDTRLQDGGNYGTGAVLAIGKPTGFIKRRTIIKFDLTGIPGNATVVNAQLKLWYSSNNGTPANNRWVQAHQLLVNWDELQATRDNRLT
ncbi:MAG: DNRLRE domain-containing protein, partial [bacterium]